MVKRGPLDRGLDFPFCFAMLVSLHRPAAPPTSGTLRHSRGRRAFSAHRVRASEQPSSPTIPERIRSDAEFSKLNELLEKSQLVKRLSDGSSWTLFAFSNSALDRTLSAIGMSQSMLMANRDVLEALLARHVVPAKVMSASLQPGTDVKTLLGASLRVKRLPSNDLAVGGSKISIMDIPTSRGVIHIVDDLILSPELAAKRYAWNLPGKAMGSVFFDPLGFTRNQTRGEIQRLREAEVTHARVAMAACAGMVLQEMWSPLLPEVVNPAIIHLQQVPAPFWQLTGALIAAIELTRARLGWEPPVEGLFTLREQYTPGNLQFDPLGLRSLFKDGLTGARAAELQWGRLAMLASVVIVSEEAVYGRTALWF